MKYYLLVLIALVLYGLASTQDSTDAIAQSDMCLQMYQLYQDTDGEYGWPSEVCE